MLNELSRQLRSMVSPGDTVICAVSAGADSMALLFGMYLLKDRLGIRLEAAHFNHGLRGAESDGDEAFVREFCQRFDIPLHIGSGLVKTGKKGLEAAAREARYAFFATLHGYIATAHTADDNAETVLMHLVRGTGLKGLGGITPQNGSLIRPMLGITRQQVIAFLREYHVSWRTDSSNDTDAFLRNRLRRHVMPLLKQENPKLAENLSAMARRLRQDEQALQDLAGYDTLPPVSALREMESAVRSRMLERFLKENGVKEPEAEHIALAENLIFTSKPSARAQFPGGVTLERLYDHLVAAQEQDALQPVALTVGQWQYLPQWGLRVRCLPTTECVNTDHVFTVDPQGEMILRSRCSGDAMRLQGGKRKLKKLYIDRKIPASQRMRIPVIADDEGVLAVYGLGVNLDRVGNTVRIEIEEAEEA